MTANVLPPGVAAAIPIKVALYKEHDVLQEVLDWARRDLKEPKDLPDKRPERGALDIEQVLDAEYAFA